MNLLQAIEIHLPSGFTVREQIGNGATSLVSLACSEATGERLIVKVMRPGSVSAEASARFYQEMRVLKRLEHRRIIPILKAGDANGAPFFTMPYISGETLSARLKRDGPRSVREALLVARDVADALGHAHSNGIVHRDVKPANILLAADCAYLMDFGFAHGSNGVPGDARLIVGTPDYVSPEQVSGNRAGDWRSDFYSLGCVMFEMLTGRAPWTAATARATMHRRLKEEPPDVRAIRPDVPDDVAAIIRRSLDPHPSGRFATAGFLLAALDAALVRQAAPTPG
jgi:serine/threonine-protein kinase